MEDVRVVERAPHLGVSWRTCLVIAALGAALVMPSTGAGASASEHSVLVSGLGSGSGSTIGPDRALYVAQPNEGTVTRVDRASGETSVFAAGLPLPLVGVGGVMDVEFIRDTAYALVTLVGADVGGTDVVGIYRIDGPNSSTPIVDLGAWSVANPPDSPFFVPTGVQYAMQAHKGGLLVTDGHHNRVLAVTLEGAVTEVIAFGNEVPTGLDLRGGRVFLAKAGPVPHLPEDGEVVSFNVRGHALREVASGARLPVDVEFGRSKRLYVLAQGLHTSGIEGSPADPDTGSLWRVTPRGLVEIADEVDRPTSMEIVGDTAYVVTIDGEVWRYPRLSRMRPLT